MGHHHHDKNKAEAAAGGGGKDWRKEEKHHKHMEQLAKLGADMRSLSEPPEDVFSGADVVVDALPPQVAGDYRERIPGALLRANVKVYFLSEYGM